MKQSIITTSEAAAKLKVIERRVRVLCAQGRIVGAIKRGRDWQIPSPPIVTAAPVNPRPGKIKIKKGR